MSSKAVKPPVVLFSAEVKQVKSRTAASGDKVYSVVMESWDPAIMNLSVLDSQILVDVEVKVQDNGSST
jgi:hypothetical protein